MARVAINNSLGGTPQNLSSSYKTIVLATASNSTSLRRGMLYEFEIGADGTPGDNTVVVDISRQTAAGTATAVTPVLLNPADGAFLGAAAANATAEGTITASSALMTMTFNQRAYFYWQAAPGSELIYPATNANGLALRAKSAAYTSTTVANVYINEQ